VEYKLVIPPERGIYLKSAVAFANGADGKLIFGVKNQTWDVIGFPDDELFCPYSHMPVPDVYHTPSAHFFLSSTLRTPQHSTSAELPHMIDTIKSINLQLRC